MRVLVATAFLGALSLVACVVHRWRAEPVTDLSMRGSAMASRTVRLETDTGTVTLIVDSLSVPWLYGEVRDAQTAGGALGAMVTVPVKNRHVVRVAQDDRARPPSAGLRVRVPFDTQSNFLNGHVVIVDQDNWRQVILSDARVLDSVTLAGRLLSGTDGRVRLDLRNVQGLQIREVNPGGTALATIGVIGATFAVAAIIVAATKESCPFAYVDTGNGWELVGEAYAGTAFRSTQREDLLPLPSPGPRTTMGVRLRNEARETQYTDRAELLLVDHAPRQRALATFDGRSILVGAARAPLDVRDADGRSLGRVLSARDDVLAERSPAAVAATPDSVLADVIVAEFDRPAGTPVLELVAGNTALLDLTFGRFFAAMGDRLAKYLELGADSTAGPRIRRWREREGVDLIVEVRTPAGWRRVAVVPTVGPAMLREIAVPLPEDASQARVAVRLRSGLGFWRVDRLALSTLEAAAPLTHIVAPVQALSVGGRDARATIAATDNRYDDLVELDDRLDMRFDLPALPAGRVRDAFLSSSGYYTVHPPVQAEWLPLTLKTIRDEPGAFSRFGRDLARAYERRAQMVASAGGR